MDPALCLAPVQVSEFMLVLITGYAGGIGGHRGTKEGVLLPLEYLQAFHESLKGNTCVTD